MDTLRGGCLPRGSDEIDDELLQELLGKATGLYNNGEYQYVIDALTGAPAADPGSARARLGIQMAPLRLAGCGPAMDSPERARAPPADRAPAAIEGLGKEALEARLDQGIRRVRALLNDRKYSEAVEGARSLVPMDPDSEEVQRLVEEAQQAFEAAPFIDEHLTLARELSSQDRLAEAEAECRKVFALDRANPDAHNLIADLRRRAREASAAPAPSAPAAAGFEPRGGVMAASPYHSIAVSLLTGVFLAAVLFTLVAAGFARQSPSVGFEVIGPAPEDARVVFIHDSGAMHWLPPEVSEPEDDHEQ